MVDVAIINGICQNDLRLEFPNRTNNGHLVLWIILEESVLKSKVFAHRNTQDPRTFLCFFRPGLRIASGTQFASGKVNNAYFVTQGYMLRDGSTTADLSVIWMCGKNKDIEFQLQCFWLTEELQLDQLLDSFHFFRNQEFLRVERTHTTGACCCNGLAIDVVGCITHCKYTFDICLR